MLDLNLIRTFAAVFEERSVTAAAHRLNVSQPSVTQALNRLRHAVGDELFRKEGRGIAPTRSAESLYEEVGQLPSIADAAVEGLLQFDPARARTTFRIALTDLGQTVFLPELVPALAKVAPHCSLDVVNLDTETVVDELQSGRVDIAVASTPLQGTIRSTVVRLDHYCCVSGEGFGGTEPRLDELGARPRVVIRDSTGHTLVESLLPPPVDGSVHLSGFSAIPGILAATELIAFVPEAVVPDWSAKWGIHVSKLPSDQFASVVRAYTVRTPVSASTAWFVDWAIGVIRA